MVKFEEAIKRRYNNVFVCKRCKTKKRASIAKIMQKKIACRKCAGKSFRPIKRGK